MKVKKKIWPNELKRLTTERFRHITEDPIIRTYTPVSLRDSLIVCFLSFWDSRSHSVRKALPGFGKSVQTPFPKTLTRKGFRRVEDNWSWSLLLSRGKRCVPSPITVSIGR